jgi:hypothetical protein
MKNPFSSKSPLEKAYADRDAVTAELAEAEHTLIAKRHDYEQSPRAEREKAGAAYRAAQDDVDVVLKPKLAKAEALIGQLKAEEAAAALQKQLEAKAAWYMQRAARFPGAMKKYVEGAAELAELAAEINPPIFDAKRLEIICSNAVLETPEHVGLIIAVLQSYAKSVPNSGDASMPQPAQAYIPPQPAETVALFAIKDVTWRAEGKVCSARRWSDISVPPATARKALAMGAAVGMDHALRREHHEDVQANYGRGSGPHPHTPPNLERCVDLDDAPADAAPVPQPAVKTQSPGTMHQPPLEIHTAFQPVDRGPGIKGTLPRNESIPATASRNLKED